MQAAPALAALTLAAALALHARTQATLRTVAQARDQARADEAEALRLLRLAAHDVRTVTMGLLGCADGLARATAPTLPHEANAIAACAGRILAVADDLDDHAVPAPTTRVIETTALPLAPLLDDAIANVAASLGPTTRAWRVDPSVRGVTLHADGRALMQVLIRVLGNAARACRPADAIEIRFDPATHTLTIEDEGTSPALPTPRAPVTPGAERRGLGLGLTLARALMEAHGGTLALEAAARVGTKVTLRFPPDRVAHARAPATAPEPPR